MRIDNLKLSIDDKEEKLVSLIEKKLKGKCGYFEILKKSLDARDKNAIVWVYSVDAYKRKPEMSAPEIISVKNPPKNIIVVGTGPAGLFCALELVKHGVIPTIIERGGTVEERALKNDNFFKTGQLDENCNVQFGEGGAGTFSDGKLNTQTNSPLNKDVLKTFVKFGAPEEILYLNKPHIGSDNLQKVIKNIRKYLMDNGCKILFNTLLCDINSTDKVKSVTLKNLKTNEIYEHEADGIVLAIGHSSRDTFEMLKRKNYYMQPREFAVGVRIEHLQEKIGFSQYGKNYKKLPSADYKLVSHASERSAFTFCMCPGGFVMPSASEKGGVVTNGMSNYARDGLNANSALLVQIKKSDFDRGDVLDGVRFQRELEIGAYTLGGGDYKAPVQRFADFVVGKESKGCGSVVPTYSAGVTYTDLNKLFPLYVSFTLKNAIFDMDKRLHGFADGDAVLTGAETRFSSPVRIIRDDNFESVSVKGVYPCGEGCGYSGGITSSAVDGIKVADKIIEKYL